MLLVQFVYTILTYGQILICIHIYVYIYIISIKSEFAK